MNDALPSLTFQRATWMADAACKGHDANWWHPPKGANSWTLKAKEICATCDVSAECIQFAMDNGEQRGIWGGISIEVHRRMSRGQARPRNRRPDGAPPTGLPLSPIEHGTISGYQKEKRRGLTICAECRAAHNAFRRERRAEGYAA